MSPIKRSRRAVAKQQAGRGRHARPASSPGTSASSGPLVPVELASPEYEFPRIELPASRPLVGRQVLAELAADDTRPLDMSTVLDGEVVDDAPKPAQAEGLVPVPSLPFLNAGVPEQPLRNGEQFPAEPESVRSVVTVGSALPEQLTAWELDLLHRPVAEILGDPDDMPTTALPAVRQAELWPAPVRRSFAHPRVFADFEHAFYDDLNRMLARVHDGEREHMAANDRRTQQLTERLAALESRHAAAIRSVATAEYAGALADSVRPLPHRIPGAALAAIEASAGQLVTA